jgi:hypothetical protein
MNRFEKILSLLNKALSEANEKTFESLFEDNKKLADEIYDHFGLSGATFIVADNNAGRFVMLQEGVKEAEQYSVNLRLRIRSGPTSQGLGFYDYAAGEHYSKFCNRIFQIQRGEEGLGDYGSKLVLPREPEFLAGIRADTAVTSRDDTSFCSAAELYRGLLAWRWLHWLIWNFGKDHLLPHWSQDLFSRTKNPRGKSIDKLFSIHHLKWFDEIGSLELPEFSIGSLDRESSWSALKSSKGIKGNGPHAAWGKYRHLLDGRRASVRTFEDECTRLEGVFSNLKLSDHVKNDPHFSRYFDQPVGIAGAIHNWIRNELCEGKEVRLLHALKLLHEKVYAPLPAYYYFIMIDGRPKEHLVMPILRSTAFPLTYYVGGHLTHRKRHTAIAISLAALDYKAENQKRKEQDILHLRHVFRTCADRIIDGIFIRSLRQEKEHKIEGQRLVTVSSVRSLPSMLFLGKDDQNITIYSQQCRALLLVRALEDMGALKKDERIGVLGGGISGTTAATALVKMGYTVDLFESGSGVLCLQENAEHRFVHPNIAKWPSVDSLYEGAGLPEPFNWSACYANELVSTLREKIRRVKGSAGDRFDILTGATIKRVTLNGGPRPVNVTYSLKKAGGREQRVLQYGLVICALGYGTEARLPGDNLTKSYWERDDLGERLHEFEKGPQTQSILVVGSGDGGLIDLARAALGYRKVHKFRHDDVLKFLTREAPLEELGLAFKEVDTIAKAENLRSGSSKLFKLYQKRYQGFNEKYRLQLIRSMKQFAEERQYADVWFRYQQPDDTIFSLQNTALINRVLAFLILESRLANILPFPVKSFTTSKDSDGREVKRAGGRKNFAQICCRVGVRPNYPSTVITALRSQKRDEVSGRLNIGSELDAVAFEWFDKRLNC